MGLFDFMNGNAQPEQNGWQGLLGNPLLHVGLGILGANQPGTNTAQAIGRGGLLGLNSFNQAQQFGALNDFRRAQIEEQKRKAQQAQQQQGYLDTAVANLPPHMQAFARAAPEAFFRQQAESLFPKPQGPMNVAPGGTVFDPTKGQPIFTAPKEPDRPVSVQPGGALVDPRTGKVVYQAPKEKDGTFAGTGMDQQAWNIVLKGQVDSPEYAAAYAHLTTPKQTIERDPETGRQMIVTFQPNMPAGIKPPTYARAPQGAPPAGGMPPAAPAPAAPAQGAPAAPGEAPQTIAPGITATPVPGMGGRAAEKLTPEQHKRGAVLNSFGGALQALIDDVKTNGLATGGMGAKGGRQNTLFRDAQLQLKEMQNLGVLNGPDERILLEMLSDPAGLQTRLKGWGGDSYFLAQLEALVEKVNRERSYLPQGVLKPEAAPKMGGGGDLKSKYGLE